MKNLYALWFCYLPKKILKSENNLFFFFNKTSDVNNKSCLFSMQL